MTKKPKRSSTKFVFNIGYVLLGTAIGLVIVGVFRGLVTDGNISEILWALLIPGAAFFGLNVARVGYENTRGYEYQDPYLPPDYPQSDKPWNNPEIEKPQE